MSRKTNRNPKKAPIKPKTTVPVASEAIAEEQYVATEIPKKTSPRMSQYEYCSLIAARVAQLTSRSAGWNTPRIPIVSPEDHDPLTIATKEVNSKLPPLVVRRTLPDGTIEDWFLKDMEFPRI